MKYLIICAVVLLAGCGARYRVEQTTQNFDEGRYCVKTYVWDMYGPDIIFSTLVFNFSPTEQSQVPYQSLKSVWHVPEITDSVKQAHYNAAVKFLEKHKKTML